MMTFSALQITLVLYFALGLRIGWTGQLFVLLVASVLACLAAFLFVSLSDGRFFVHYLFAAAASDVAIQVGFVVGLLTATRSEGNGTDGKSWVKAAIARIDDRSMPTNMFSRLTAFAQRAASDGVKPD